MTSLISASIDIADLKTRTDLLALIGGKVKLKKAATTGGGEWSGPCPFCPDQGDDRFRVWPATGRWWCRRCGRSGDALDYVAELHGLQLNVGPDFRRACQLLGKPAMLATTRPPRPAPTAKRYPPPAAEWQAKARQISQHCQDMLWGPAGAPARQYLRGRGLTEATLRKWSVGYLPGLGSGHNVAGLFVPYGIILPCEINGVLYSIKVRRHKAMGGPKYLLVRGSSLGLYMADTLPGQVLAVLCEGEFDAMLLFQEAGDLAGVCTLGSATAPLDIPAGMKYLMALKRVLVAYDNDAAGRDGAERVEALTRRARRLTLPRDAGVKDLTDYHQHGGNLRSWLAVDIACLDAPWAEQPVGGPTALIGSQGNG